MTIKKIADACGANQVYAYAPFDMTKLYTESDVATMLRYVAMEVAKKCFNPRNTWHNGAEEAIVNQVLGEE